MLSWLTNRPTASSCTMSQEVSHSLQASVVRWPEPCAVSVLIFGVRTDVREETCSSSGGLYVDFAGYRKPKAVVGICVLRRVRGRS
jgi:hypothetical protein